MSHAAGATISSSSNSSDANAKGETVTTLSDLAVLSYLQARGYESAYNSLRAALVSPNAEEVRER